MPTFVESNRHPRVGECKHRVRCQDCRYTHGPTDIGCLNAFGLGLTDGCCYHPTYWGMQGCSCKLDEMHKCDLLELHMPYETKQVIVVRKDLKMRRGKESAQVAHAAMKFMADALAVAMSKRAPFLEREYMQDHLTDDARAWLAGSFAKVVVSVDSIQELEEIEENARAVGLTVRRIVDAGRTEFNGVPTHTCVAIGPNKSEEIDKITGHLKLR
jgi:PTH2 family peptidyl-tRNA hydrolase